MKKKYLISACILFGFLIYTFLTTYSLNDHRHELIHFSNQYVNGNDLTLSVLKDSYSRENEVFTLYENKGEYFIVWSVKDIWSLGRYKVIGGTIPHSSNENFRLSEFQKADSEGFVYVLYGKYKQSQIDLKVTNGEDSTQIKKYKVNGDHTFVVYTSNHDCTIEPILDRRNS